MGSWVVDALATLCSVLVAIPQIRRLRAGESGGLSSTTLGMVMASTVGWAGYALLAGLPALCACSTLSFGLRVVLARRLGPGRRRAWAVAVAVVAVDLVTGLVFGLAAAGLVLAAQGLVQYLPQAITAWRSSDVTGISRGSQRLQAMAGLAWGVSGAFHGDPALMAWSVSTTTTSGSVLLRLRAT